MCLYGKSGQWGAAAMGLYPHAIHRVIHRMWIKSVTIHMLIPRMWITHDFVDNLIHRVASLWFSAHRKNAVEQVT